MDARRGSRSVRSLMQMPPVGTRVMVRHRLPAGSVPPLTDVIGHLVADGSDAAGAHQARGRGGTSPLDDVVVIKALGAAPVRTADIRNLEHAAALAWPGVEQQWVGGWLLRSARQSPAAPIRLCHWIFRRRSPSGAGDRRLVCARGPHTAGCGPDRLIASARWHAAQLENRGHGTRCRRGILVPAVTLAPRPDAAMDAALSSATYPSRS